MSTVEAAVGWVEAIRDGRRARLRTMQGTPQAEGRVIAYTDAPTIVIQTESGKHISWRADLADILPTEAELLEERVAKSLTYLGVDCPAQVARNLLTEYDMAPTHQEDA